MTESVATEMRREEIRALLACARRLARRWCPASADGDDVAQEAVMGLLGAGDRPRNARAWLAVVTRRLCNRHRLRDLARGSAESVYAVAKTSQTAAYEVIFDLYRVLEKLGERDRRLIERIIEGRNTAEIADEFGCASRDVGQMVARARRKARRVRDDEDR